MSGRDISPCPGWLLPYIDVMSYLHGDFQVSQQMIMYPCLVIIESTVLVPG